MVGLGLTWFHAPGSPGLFLGRLLLTPAALILVPSLASGLPTCWMDLALGGVGDWGHRSPGVPGHLGPHLAPPLGPELCVELVLGAKSLSLII